MFWHIELFPWLLGSAVLGGIVLAIGAAAVVWRRQPIERLRLVEWALAACLLAPLAQFIPGLPHWSLGWMAAGAGPVDRIAPDDTHWPPAVKRSPEPGTFAAEKNQEHLAAAEPVTTATSPSETPLIEPAASP